MRFPIVGIGASAGGLEPLVEILGALPVDTGMAYIIVQHLNADYKSLLSEILAKKTQLPLVQLHSNCEVQPDTVYLIAPNTTIALVNDIITVIPRQGGVHHPADILFNSLAQHRADRAIGIVLSGGDGDGALGVQAIKQAGGITFAQEPASARFPSMPETAIETGCVDFIRRPSDMVPELLRLARHPYLKAEPAPGATDPDADPNVMSEASLRKIFRLLRSAHGVDFTHYKRSTLGRRLERRMAFHKIHDVEDYAALVATDGVELASLYQDFLIRVTGFFRDPASYEALLEKVFPTLCEGRPPNAPIRIWVPGCATGEEVYSIAIALTEYLSSRSAPDAIQIFGTDVSDSALEKARAGSYLENIVEEVSAERLVRFFEKHNGHYRIAKNIRDLCVFARHDITRDPPFSRLGLLSCRNLLIYLDAVAQRRVMESFHYALRPRGFLLLGSSETVGSAASLFDAVDPHHRLFVPNAAATVAEFQRHSITALHPPGAVTEQAVDPAAMELDLAQREADRLLLSRFAPASVLIDDSLNILQFRGETSPYIEHASGPSSLNLQRVVRSELLVVIAPAIQKARESGLEVRASPVRLDERPELVIEVIPLRRASADRCFLILFEGAAQGPAARRAQTAAPLPESEKDRHIAHIEQENTSLRDYLQATIEEHEANQEELKSAHEEVMSANEEFQSTNEELETAKEELQSANEELSTTNEELRERNRELGALNAALGKARLVAERAQAAADIIVESVREPLLVLDEKLNIVRANRAYYVDFAARPEEVEGRFLYHVSAGRWNVAALRQGLLDVMARSETLEDFEIGPNLAADELRSFSLNARKMLGDEERPALILLAIADVTARNIKNAQLAQEMNRKDEFLSTLARELRNPLAPIATAVELLRVDAGGNSTTGLYDVIDRQTRRLTRLVDELLDAGRLDRGLITLQRMPVNLATILEGTVATMRPQLSARRHELIISVPKEPVTVNGDPMRLEQVITNLLDNASKYTEPGGRITLTLNRTEQEAVLGVKDSGIGLEQAVLERIFVKLTQARAADHGGEGLGIGLTLARRVVDLHGGRLEAHSEGLGKGSEFFVHLPLADNLSLSASDNLASPRPNRSGKTAEARRILIVDDNEDARVSLALLIRSWGHSVMTAADGPGAIAAAEQFNPQSALVDIGMPGMNGYQVARHFRALPRYADLQLIAMTGFGREEERRAASAAGFNHHLVKPVAFAALERLLISGGAMRQGPADTPA